MITAKKHRWLRPMHILLLAAAVSLVACSDSDSDSDSNNSSSEGGNSSSASSSHSSSASGNSNSSGSSSSDVQAEMQSYDVQLEGEQEVPMVRTEQSAMASLTINETDMTVTAEMDLSDVTGVTAAHIHAGEVGNNGSAIFGFSDANSDDIWLIESEGITQSQYGDLLAGNWYVNVHTDNFPDGELRGQVLTDTQSVHVFTLSGEQEVPPVQTGAYGQAYLWYDHLNGAMTLNIRASNLNAIAAHIHHAEAGLNGEIVVAWEANADNGGVWRLPEGTILGSNEVTALQMADLYIDIHTEANPDGEIRGQILPDNYALLLFDLSPDQEVPRVDSNASGVGYATLNTESGGLRLNAWSMNMATNAAHIHQGGIGQNGDVVMELEENMSHAGLWQMPENTALGSEAQALLLAGGHYVNMHSVEFPGGEIRGQVTPKFWNVLAFALSGSQEVPAVETGADGDGYALVNTESGDLMMVVNTRNLNTASAAHIHTGTAGVNGDVLLGLEQDSADASIWRLAVETSLDEASLADFLNAGHYVNVHSPSNPDGEIRGQIVD